MASKPTGNKDRRKTKTEGAPQTFAKMVLQTILLATRGVNGTGALPVWSVVFIPSEEGCRGRHTASETTLKRRRDPYTCLLLFLLVRRLLLFILFSVFIIIFARV